MSELTLTALLRRDRATLVIAIVIVTVSAWAYLFWLAAQMGMAEMRTAATAEGAMAGMNIPSASETMAGMDLGSGMGAALEPTFRPWSVADFAFMFTMWAIMMVGMMTPSVAPMVLLYAAVGRNAAAGLTSPGHEPSCL